MPQGKIAWRTIPRCGWTALLFLFAGLCMLFSTCLALQQLQAQRNIPFETTASITGEAIVLEDLRRIKGIEGISPVLQMDAELISEDHSLSCEIIAVLRDYLDLSFTKGTLFPERSNMPYLIGNEAVLAHGLSCGETVTLRTGTHTQAAMLCGIFDDGRTEPSVYMSYETANAAFSQSACRELILTLSGTAAWEGAAAELQERGVLVEGNPSPEPDGEQVRSRAAICVCLLSCAAALLRERRRQELAACADELRALHTSGLQELRAIYPLRLLMGLTLCAICVAVTCAVN